jgi:hypothetical protein
MHLKGPITNFLPWADHQVNHLIPLYREALGLDLNHELSKSDFDANERYR